MHRSRPCLLGSLKMLVPEQDSPRSFRPRSHLHNDRCHLRTAAGGSMPKKVPQ